MNDARVDLFDTGRDPFSPAALQASSRGGDCEVVAEIVRMPPFGQPDLQIIVIGTPRPQGSKKAFYNAKLGRALVVNDNDARLRTWRQDVVTATVKAMRAAAHTQLPPRTAIAVVITFLMPRPKGHWRSGRNAHLLRDDVLPFPSVKPDGDKLLRSTLDALRDAGVYVDDAQVVDFHVRKRWAAEWTGAVINVREAGAQRQREMVQEGAT